MIDGHPVTPGWARAVQSATAPYLALARVRAPIGYWLLMWPCWWAVALAQPERIDRAVVLLGLFLAGAVVMRSAGCAFNDIIDRDFDRQVARTRVRPLASGALSVPRAVVFMVAMGLIGLAILLQLNATAVIVGLGAVPLIAAYPFMKRITWWPQAWLGLTFNWGALVGWAAVTGELAAPALWLYAAGVAWTLGYDTIYAHQDKEDDALIGVKSSALRLGAVTRPWLYVFYALTVAGLAVAFWTADLGWPAYVGLGLGAIQLAWQARYVDLDSPDSCLAMFKSNHGFSAVIFIAIVAGGL